MRPYNFCLNKRIKVMIMCPVPSWFFPVYHWKFWQAMGKIHGLRMLKVKWMQLASALIPHRHCQRESECSVWRRGKIAMPEGQADVGAWRLQLLIRYKSVHYNVRQILLLGSDQLLCSRTVLLGFLTVSESRPSWLIASFSLRHLKTNSNKSQQKNSKAKPNSK